MIKRNELSQRALTALLIVVVIIAGTLVSKYTYGLLFLLVTLISSREYIHITGLGEISEGKKWILITVNVLVFLLGFGIAINFLPKSFRIFGIIPVFLLFSTGLYGKSSPNHNIASILITGHVYIGIPLMLLSYIYLHKNDFWPSYIIAILCFVWANDAGAYMIGSRFGKHKMALKISPKKSWEGFFGGIACAMLAGFLFSLLSKNLTMVQWVIFGLLAGIGSSFGDLIGSSLKRTYGVKDSGSFFPGHGGFIDRFDGFFIAIVFVFTYLTLLGIIY